MMLPEKIPVPTAPSTAEMSFFMRAEIEALNAILTFTRSALAGMLADADRNCFTEASVEFAQGKFPMSWRRPTGLWHLVSTNHFSSHLIERHSQLMRCVQEVDPVVFDVRLLENPAYLFEAFITDCALAANRAREQMEFEFKAAEGAPEVEGSSLFLTRTVIVGASLKGGQLSLTNDNLSPPGQAISSFVAKVVAVKPNAEKLPVIPMYRQAIAPIFVADAVELRHLDHGCTPNFVLNVPIATELTQTEIEMAGVGIYCQMPSQLG
jgi:hypothetical protein